MNKEDLPMAAFFWPEWLYEAWMEKMGWEGARRGERGRDLLLKPCTPAKMRRMLPIYTIQLPRKAKFINKFTGGAGRVYNGQKSSLRPSFRLNPFLSLFAGLSFFRLQTVVPLPQL